MTVRKGLSRNTIKKNLYTEGTAWIASLNVSLSIEYRVYLEFLEEEEDDDDDDDGLSEDFIKSRRISVNDCEDDVEDDRRIAVTAFCTSRAIFALICA